MLERKLLYNLVLELDIRIYVFLQVEDLLFPVSLRRLT